MRGGEKDPRDGIMGEGRGGYGSFKREKEQGRLLIGHQTACCVLAATDGPGGMGPKLTVQEGVGYVQ